FDTWAKEIRRAYPDAAEGVLALERETGKNSTEGVLRRIDAIEKHFADMKAFAQVWLPKSEEIRKMLAGYGAPVNPHEVGISAQQIEDGVLYAKELRNRYGLLQILFDLGLLAPFATRLAQYFEN
ncbi:MAG: sn-glycerol-1-phosphate dehydrogenase, partial [Christensenellales bacterium]